MKDNILNRFFTQSNIEELIRLHKNSIYEEIVGRYLDNDHNIQNKDVMKAVYKYMEKNYRNEYFFQNTIFNKILLGRHSLNTTTALTQIPISKSRADVIMINGKAVVYEIKTGLDNFDRLAGQINDYYKAFDNVCVVIEESSYERLDREIINENVGIIILTKKNTLRYQKKAKSNVSCLEPEEMFKILRKYEYENIIKNHYGELVKSSPVFYYKKSMEAFKKIEMGELYRSFLNELKKRNKVNKNNYQYVPYELKSLFYFLNASVDEYTMLSEFLCAKYKEE